MMLLPVELACVAKFLNNLEGIHDSYLFRSIPLVVVRGQLPIAELPKGISGARIALCLVRRSNRDGHCMRTFEVPAAGG